MDPRNDATPLLRLAGVRKSFRTPEGTERLVLDRVDFRLEEGEIVALLGRSGSGKSTLLRIMAGLIGPNGGEILYRGRPLHGPARGISMVFQSFALFPWLTVQGNVELGLEALGIPRQERAARALAAIELIGLSGFESAYPKELSGGMRQRVGIARALVLNPEILLMDEAFSALDVLTAETLRDEIMELWLERRIPTKAILMVSHNIEEAVLMANRVLVFSTDPGRVSAEIPVDLSYPRDRDAPEFRQLLDEAYSLIAGAALRVVPAQQVRHEPLGLGYRLPDAAPGPLTALLEALAEAPFEGRADLPKLADVTELPDNTLLSLIEGLRILGFAELDRGDAVLSPAGRAYVEADPVRRREIFAEHMLHHLSLAAHIRRVLDERYDHRAPEERFLQELQDYHTAEEAERVLTVIIEWGRFAELFDYDYNAGILSLPQEDGTGVAEGTSEALPRASEPLQ